MPVAILFPPVMILSPAMATRSTVLTSPGSNRTAVPAGISSRFPKALARSKESSGFVSIK